MVNSCPPKAKLHYSIHSYSGYIANFHPQNLLNDNPQDQSSRWASDSNGQHHFVMLKLENLSVLRTITFGKYQKSHVCNLKEFKVYAGMDPESLQLVLHGGLHNDSELETFPVKFSKKKSTGDEIVFPCQFVKIVPLSAHGGSFNYSIWYIELGGNQDGLFVNQVMDGYLSFKQVEAMKLCLKHLRKTGYEKEFEGLLAKSGLQLEHPSVTRLFGLVRDGDFNGAEKLISQVFESEPTVKEND